jgi:NADPH:quinone reductase
MYAIVVETHPAHALTLAEVPEPVRGSGELLVAVRALSLNRGEVRHALSEAPAGYRPGWDFAGVIEAAPGDSGFRSGDRIVGLLPQGAWAERIAVPPMMAAAIPEGVGFAEAAAMGVAGLTASLALSKRGALDGLRVLVTGATGGVGVLAVQLAARAGAHVTALVRDETHQELLRRLGAHTVAVGLERMREAAPFDLVVESVGGGVLGAVLGKLAPRGVCVLVGDAEGSTTTFDANRFRYGEGFSGGTTLYGFFLGEELMHVLPAAHLVPLLQQVGAGTLQPVLALVRPWGEIATVARDLLDRRFTGKAVLTLDAGR